MRGHRATTPARPALAALAAFAAVVALVFAAAACSSSSSNHAASTTTSATTSIAAGSPPRVVTMTFVDRARPTAAWKRQPARPQRTLVTTIVYPATRAHAPYPLIAFSHGFGADPQSYLSLLRWWAAQGFVVAAPAFPLTSSTTPGGADEADLSNQPGDISYVITSVLAASARAGNPLSGLVNANEVGAAGHSNGAITTLGLVANTCCRDPRLKAAAVLAGTQSATFNGGRYNFSQTPPILFVHGSGDALIPYNDGITAYNDAHGPKALLTINGGDHGSAAGSSASSRQSVFDTTTDFFLAYLAHDGAAQTRLAANDASPKATEIHTALAPGSTATIATVPAPKLDLHATVTPQHGLRAGQTVTVTWSGYEKGKTVNVLECAHPPTVALSEASCGFTNADLLHPDPTGSGTATIKIGTGKVGDGVCDAQHECTLVVNNGGSVDPKSSTLLAITFA